MARVMRLLPLLVAALLCASLVCGVPDEATKPWKFSRAMPFGDSNVVKSGQDGADNGFISSFVNRVFSGPIEVEPIRDVKAEQIKRPDGLLSKAWAYVSGFTNPLGSALHIPAGFLERQKVAPASEERHGHRHVHSGAVSSMSGIRDVIGNQPEKRHYVVAATEPLVLKDGSSPAAPFATKLSGVVRKILDDYYATTVVPKEKSTCIGIVEEEVRKLFSSLKYKLQEELCDDFSTSASAQGYCKLFSLHPKLATLMVLGKVDFNPVTAALARASTAGFCSEQEHNEVLENLHLVEQLARMDFPHMHFHIEHHVFHERNDGFKGHDQKLDLEEPYVSGTFAKDKHEHDHGLMHWFGRFRKARHDEKPNPRLHDHHMILGKYKHEEDEHNDEHEDEHQEDEHNDEHEDEHNHEHVLGGFLKKHKLHLKSHELESGREMPKRHWWRREHEEMNAREELSSSDHLDENLCHDCFVSGIHNLAKGISRHMKSTCRSATDPKLVTACDFVKEHRCLSKTHLSVRIPIWEMAGFHCTRRCRAQHDIMGHDFHKHSGPRLEVDSVKEFALPLGGRFRLHFAPGLNLLYPDSDMRQLRHGMSGGCGRHQVNQSFKKSMQLRGHVLGVSNDNNGDVDLMNLPGSFRTKLIVWNGNSFHSKNFQDAVVTGQPLVQRLVRDIVKDFQDEMGKMVDAASSSESELRSDQEAVLRFKTLSPNFENWKGPLNFRISARPRFLPTGDQDLDERAASLDKDAGGLRLPVDKGPHDGDVTQMERPGSEAHEAVEGGRADM